MARETRGYTVVREDGKFKMPKRKVFVWTDDRAVYEFVKPDEREQYEFMRGFSPEGEVTHVKGAKILPKAVKHTAESLFGDRWFK